MDLQGVSHRAYGRCDAWLDNGSDTDGVSSLRPDDELGRDRHERHGHEADPAGELIAVLAAVDAGIIVTDPAGRVRSQNEAAARILDGDVSDLLEILGPLGRRELAPGAADGGETSELQIVRLPDRWLQVSRFAGVHDATGPDSVGEVVLLRDVTQSRQTQFLREAFLGMLSHELRTPVTSIFAASGLLGPRLSSTSDDECAELVCDIAYEAERLLRLVDDLLVLAHFDEGIDLIGEPSLLQRIIPTAVERERRRWPAIVLRLEVDGDLPVVSGDEISVQQVARNLISNAAKYGQGEPVLIRIQASEDEPGAIVRVLDRGPGVPPDAGEALFRPFYRSARTATHGGAGIGLFVCRCLVEAMGGHLWMRQRPGGGSEFGFWLPRYDLEPDDGAVHDAAPDPIIASHRQEESRVH